MADQHNGIKSLTCATALPMKCKWDVQALILMVRAQMQQLGVTVAKDEQFYKDLKCHKLSKKHDLEASEEGADFKMMGIGLWAFLKVFQAMVLEVAMSI